MEIFFHFPSFLDIFSLEHKTYVSYTVNTMAVDDLVTQGARVSAAIVATQFLLNIPTSAPELRVWK